MPRRLAYTFAMLVALGVGYFVAGIPIQLTDCLANMMAGLEAFSLSEWRSGAGYLRPLLNDQVRVAMRFSDGYYFATFKAIHIAQLAACALLLVRLVRPVTWPRAVAAALGVTVLFGGHTFTGTIMEAFPINTFLTIVVCVLLAANLSFSEPAWWKDLSVVALFAFAVLTVESGVLVLVVTCAAKLVGARGVSRRGIAALLLLLVGYLMLRFGGGHFEGPALTERPSGFGFVRLEGPELEARFGANPALFYAYNILSQVLTVVFAEPREGVWDFTYFALHRELLPRQVIALASSAGITLAIAAFVATRRRRWRRWNLEYDDQLVAVYLAALAANAVVSYPYVKDVIMSPAGAFSAVAGAVAVANLLASLEQRRTVPAIAVALGVAVLSACWSIRTVGADWNLRRYAFVVRNEWVTLDDWIERNRIETTPARLALAHALQEDALLRRRVPVPLLANPRAERYLLP